MVNGTIVPSRVKWKGRVIIVNIKIQGEFEVFDSSGGWYFLFRKPLLQAFRAVHEYKMDTVHITGEGGSTIIHNQDHNEPPNNKTTSNKRQGISIVQNTIAEGGNPSPKGSPIIVQGSAVN